MTCKGTKEVTMSGVRSVVACCLTAHDAESPHRWQGQADGAAIAIEWYDRSKVLRDSALNGIRTGLQRAGATDEEIALALLGYLADRPGGRGTKTRESRPPIAVGLREAEAALARGWKYVAGTVDAEPMPEPFGSRVRGANWELLDGDTVLLRAAEQRWIAVDLLDGDASFQAQVRACRPFVSGPAVLYILGLERRHRDLCGDYRVIVAPDAHGRFYVGALPDHDYLLTARQRERVEAERLAQERERAWQGRY